jgi:hypothetical protein
MTIYYRDCEVVVTSTGVRVHGRDLPLNALRQVWHRRGSRSWGTIAGRGALGVAMLCPIALAVLGVGVAVLLDASTSMTLGLIGGGILVGLCAIPLADVLLDKVDRSYDRGSRDREIWARTPSGDVLLLRTRDAARFGRIYRAVQRALESSAQVTRR